MLKSNHREVMIFLLGGLSALGGKSIFAPGQPSFPERRDWTGVPSIPCDFLKELIPEKEKSPPKSHGVLESQLQVSRLPYRVVSFVDESSSGRLKRL